MPWIAYVGLAACACAARSHVHEALFGLGGVSLVLLLLGIHNAWDTVSYHVLVHKVRQMEEGE